MDTNDFNTSNQIVFWQNLISPHQFSLMNLLSEKYDILLFVIEEISENRKSMGWKVPNLNSKVKVLRISDIDVKKTLKATKNDLHFFSGLYSYKEILNVLKLAFYNENRINIIAEPQNWIGLKGIHNNFRTFLFFLKYGSRIEKILAIGSKGSWWYQKCGFPSHKIFEWAYVIKTPSKPNNLDVNQNDSPQILFLGRLIPVKGLKLLINCLKNISEEKYSNLFIVGEGSQLSELKELVNHLGISHKVKFVGKVKSDQTPYYLYTSDLLILPSIGKEGWGAVVSESLLTGTPVIVSDDVGASAIVNDNNGFVFNSNNSAQLISSMNKALSRIQNYTPKNRLQIKSDSINSFGDQVLTDYFLKICAVSNSTDLIAPWNTIDK